MSINNLVKQLKQENQDFEFYPSTKEILNVVQQSINKQFQGRESVDKYSLMDCGAGDGRTLKSLGHEYGDCFAIEKSKVLLNEIDKNVYIVGTEFNETTLIDKEVDVIFCNPPYTEYAQWASKIIQEANAKHIYLVIPDRWKNNDTISNAIKLRGVEDNAKVLGSFDFLDGDRKARANVDIIHIKLDVDRGWRNALKSDPFDVWFDENFTINEKIDDEFNEEKIEEKIKGELVSGGNIIKTLVELYNNEMGVLNDNFVAVSGLSASILKELDVNVSNIKAALKQRIKGLKNKYWRELFKNYDVINKKLTVGSLESMMKRLDNQTSVDFTESNAIAITGWVIKNANGYFDSQLINAVENITRECNIVNYKSNNRVFNKEEWRYNRREYTDSIRDYGLDLRCILEGQGGVSYGNSFYSWDYVNGMGKCGTTTINDLIVIANNLGFNCSDRVETMGNWGENKNQNIKLYDGTILMNVKAYLNGNLHIKFNQKFLKTLNVEFGRLKGWLKSKEQAADELDINVDDIDNMFYSNAVLGRGDVKLLVVD